VYATPITLVNVPALELVIRQLGNRCLACQTYSPMNCLSMRIWGNQ